jgi:hypothetical protein
MVHILKKKCPPIAAGGCGERLDTGFVTTCVCKKFVFLE